MSCGSLKNYARQIIISNDTANAPRDTLLKMVSSLMFSFKFSTGFVYIIVFTVFLIITLIIQGLAFTQVNKASDDTVNMMYYNVPRHIAESSEVIAMSLPITASVNSISSGLENMKQDADRIAGASAKGGEDIDDLANAMVDLNADRRQVEASVKVVQSVDEVLGSLIDTRA